MPASSSPRLARAGYYLRRLHRARPRHVRQLIDSRRKAPETPEVHYVGIVEKFSRERIDGWIAVPREAAPVRIGLFLNGHEIAASWATGVSDRGERTSWSQVRTFRFFLQDLWTYVRPADRLTVRADGVPLPIAEVGMFLRPESPGTQTPQQLRKLLADGHVFEQYGKLSLSKQRDVEWQQRVMGLFADVRTFISDRFDYDIFFIYGTLLGAVRENGFIGHDIDLDTAFLSRQTDGRDAAAELRDIAFALIDAGYLIESFRTHLHITRADGTRIDLFHVYFDDRDRLSLPFGIAGTSVVKRNDWQGLREIEFPGGTGVIPVNSEQMAAHLYGEDWRSPKPGFHWPKDRTKRAARGIMPLPWHEEIYWADFYAHKHYDTGSTFQTFVADRDDTPTNVIDIGCGDGRDSFAFAQGGRTVLGLDRSYIGVQYAGKKAAKMGLGERVDFRAVDVSQTDDLRSVLSSAVADAGEAPVMFYMRFFLHSIPKDTQDALMEVIKTVARPGDMLAAEFRTDKDEKLAKVHTRHYRRYQDGDAYGESLRSQYDFDPIFEISGTGFSPYGDEDPELYRVVARRPG